MLTGLENGLGLEIVVWLQAHGGPLLDLLARLLNVMGSSMFPLVIAPLVYWSVSKRLGLQMALMLLAGGLIAFVIKQAAQTPRPFVAHPDEVNALFEVDGYGLPSGHVITALMSLLPVVVWLKDQRWWWAYGAFVLVMGWSRMYSGMHYPQDVMASLLLGAVLIAWYMHHPPGMDVLHHGALIAGALIVPWFLVDFFADYHTGLSVLGMAVGWGMGLPLEARYVEFETDGSLRQRALRYVVGIVLMLGLFFGLRVAFGTAEPQALLRVVRYATVTVFLLAGWPALWSRVDL